jgi:hypothetical protein
MGLDKEAQEFNEAQKRYREQEHLHKHTVGADHRELMGELKRVNINIGFIIDMIQQWMVDEEKRRMEEHRRSTYGMYDPYRHRTQRGPDDHYRWTGSGAHRPSPHERRWQDTPPPYNPEEDPDNVAG